MMSKLWKKVRRHRFLAVLITIAFLFLAITYSIITPIFESPDELWHYPFVWHLAQSGELPVQNPTQPQLWGQEGSQPPLYYALAALLTAAVPADDLPGLVYRNPHADLGLVSADGNANIVVHTKQEAWPWQGAVLTIHLARFFSVLLGAGTVLTIYALGRTLWPERPALALLAISFVAFNPMFLFISGSVNNDNLITWLASLTLWWLVWLIVNHSKQKTIEPSRWHFVGLGVLVGLAALTKVSGLGLLGLVGLTLLWWGACRRSWRTALLGNSLVGLLGVAIAGWWYWRNFSLYGDWTGTENMVAIMGARPVPPTAGQLLAEMPGFLRSFWGMFGYFSVPMPFFLYWVFNIILATGLIGLLTTRFPPGLRQTWPVLVVWLAIMGVGLLRWTLRTPATQGRLLFPALAALAVLWAVGWLALIPTRWQILPALIMGTSALWVPRGVIAPAYARPTLLDSLPPSAQALEATFGNAVELLAFEQQKAEVYPGDTVPLSLYWRSSAPVGRDYTLFVHLLDENDLVIAQRNLFHGSGAFPTSQWRIGDRFRDTYVLRLPPTAFAPTQARFEVGLYDHRTGIRLPVSTGEDHVRFGGVVVLPRAGALPNPQTLQFEEGIILAGYNLDRRQVAAGDTITLTLYWQSERVPTRNYKVFAHLIGAGDYRVTQHDSEPQNGAAPTSGWISGQVVTDPHLLAISSETPNGAYRLVVGLYEEDSGQRLRLLHNGYVPVQADSVALTSIRVIPKN